ncbi:galactosyl transferase gma12 mnn10 family protein [Diplodia corticola]|uniref:Galactosyl transferase gma12 mnn10 family protein n=1 Tax=Diplodia corticola TaxID=236234 RepID=A0A1J9RDM2_9PEZI|nr:galactosyl transferase gma12 mnn10 family protein [Diplodia corticola]OJD30651.1 galactosyl transferase gma12 mnn10 family protein [Diplodia corticola]
MGLSLYRNRHTLVQYLPQPPPVEEPLPHEAQLCQATAPNNSVASPSNMRIGKCTAHYGKIRPTYERARRTHDLHNKIHGIRPLVLREELVEGLWNKPAFILSVLLDELQKPAESRLQWLLWVDIDTIVLNPCVPMQAFLPPDDLKNVHMVVTKDWNGLNNGVFFVRVDAWAVELFSNILAFRYYRPDVYLRFTEQSAMSLLLEEEKFRDGAVYVPQRWFNSYPGNANDKLEKFQTRRGDFLVHLAGWGEKSMIMREWLAIAERHAPDWMLEFWRTAYPDEVEEFWTNYADKD